MHSRILSGLILGAAVAACAQTTNSPANQRSLSLGECIDLALNRNLELQIERLTVEMAGDVLNSAHAVYAPNDIMGATHSYVTDLRTYDERKFNSYFPAEITSDE